MSKAQMWNENPLTMQRNSIARSDIDTAQVVETRSQVKGIKAKIYLDKNHFITGQQLRGCLVINCQQMRMKIKSIQLDFVGIESSKSNQKDIGESVNVFHKDRICFQNTDTAPSDAVVAGYAQDGDGYWFAKQGKTKFDFSFKLPQNAPSSFKSNFGVIKHQLIVSLELKNGTNPVVLKNSHEVQVYAEYQRNFSAEKEEMESSEEVWGFFKGKGPVTVTMFNQSSNVLAGQHAQVLIEVDNQSKSKVQSVQLNLIKRLKTFTKVGSDQYEPVKFLRKIIAKEHFAGKDYSFDDRKVELSLLIPNSELSILNATLVEVSYLIQAQVKSQFNRDIVVELPLNVCFSMKDNVNEKIIQSIPPQADIDEEDESVLAVEVENDIDKSKQKLNVDSAYVSNVNLIPTSRQNSVAPSGYESTYFNTRRSTLSPEQVEDINKQFEDIKISVEKKLDVKIPLVEDQQKIDPRIMAHMKPSTLARQNARDSIKIIPDFEDEIVSEMENPENDEYLQASLKLEESLEKILTEANFD